MKNSAGFNARKHWKKTEDRLYRSFHTIWNAAGVWTTSASSNLFPVGLTPPYLNLSNNKYNIVNLRSCFLISLLHKKSFHTMDMKLLPMIHEGNYKKWADFTHICESNLFWLENSSSSNTLDQRWGTSSP